jgi:uncharacterized protein (UPF0548 family)
LSRWRFGRGWSEEVLRRYLAEVRERRPNFSTAPEEMTPENGWTVDRCREAIGREPPGPPIARGLFERARSASVNYDFSDPHIVVGHFDPSTRFLGRDLLLEIKVFGLRFLGGVRVTSVREENDAGRTVFGFRYDTIEGHFERGSEWFLLTKEHATGEVTFEIEAHWRPGDFPTWWARIGFLVLGERFRELWRRQAVRRMRCLAVERKRYVPGTQPERRGDDGGGN